MISKWGNIAEIIDLNQAVGLASVREHPLPDWPVESWWLWLLLGVFCWLVGRRITSGISQALLQAVAVGCLVLGGGALLSESIRQWILLAFSLGIGWSVRNLVVDLLCGILIRFEGNLPCGCWLDVRRRFLRKPEPPSVWFWLLQTLRQVR